MVQLEKIDSNYLHLQPNDAEETNTHVSSHVRITNGLQKIKKPVTKNDILFPSVRKKSSLTRKTTKKFRPPWVSSTNYSSLSVPRVNEQLKINPGLQNAGQKPRRKSHKLDDAEEDKIQIKSEQVANNLLPRFRSLPHRRLGKVQQKNAKTTKIAGLNKTQTSQSEQRNVRIKRGNSLGLLKGVNPTASDFFAPSHESPKQSETVLESHPLPIHRGNLGLEYTEDATIAPVTLQISSNFESTHHSPPCENLAVILSTNSSVQYRKNKKKLDKVDSQKPPILQFDAGAESERPLILELSTYYTESHSLMPQSLAYPIIKNIQTAVLDHGNSPLRFHQSKSIETDINTGVSSGLRHFADLRFSTKIHSPNNNSSNTIGSPSLMHDEVTTVDCYGEKGLLAVDSFNKFLKLNGLLRPWYDFATQISTKLAIATKSTSAEAQANSAATQADHYIPLSNTTTTHEVQVNTRKRTRQAHCGVKIDSSVNTDRKSFRLPKTTEPKFVPETTDTVVVKTSDGRTDDMLQNLSDSHDENLLEGPSFVGTRKKKKKGRRNNGTSTSLQKKPKVIGEFETNKLNNTEEISGIPNNKTQSVVLTKSLRKVSAKANTRTKSTKDADDTDEPSICTNKSKTSALIGLPILLPEPVALPDVNVDNEKSKDDINHELLYLGDANIASKSESKAVDVATTEVPPAIPQPTKSSTTKLSEVSTRSRTKSSISQRQRHLKTRKFKELGPVKSEIERREQISTKISSMLQDKEIVVNQPRNKSVPTGEARRLNKNFIREKIMHQESDVHRKLRSIMELQAQQTETTPRHQDDLSWTTRPVTPAPLPRRSIPSLQTSVQEELDKLLKLRSPVIWTFGYTQLSVAKNIQQTLSKLEDIFQLHEINLDIEVTRWATSPRLKKLTKLATEPSSFPDAVTYHAGKVLNAVKGREGNLKNFSSKEICELLKLALIHAQAIYNPRGYLILNFPITLEEGDDFESLFYPCASGLYFLNNQWSRDKSILPDVQYPMYVTRAQIYNEANLESIAERYGERTIKVSNMDDLSPTKLERIVFAFRHNLDSYIQNITGPTYSVPSSKHLDATTKPVDVPLLATPPKSSKNSNAPFSKSKRKTYNKTRKKVSVQQQRRQQQEEITLKNVA